MPAAHRSCGGPVGSTRAAMATCRSCAKLRATGVATGEGEATQTPRLVGLRTCCDVDPDRNAVAPDGRIGNAMRGRSGRIVTARWPDPGIDQHVAGGGAHEHLDAWCICVQYVQHPSPARVVHLYARTARTVSTGLERVMHLEMRCVGRQRCGAGAAWRRLGSTKAICAARARCRWRPIFWGSVLWRADTASRALPRRPAWDAAQRTPCLDAPQGASHSPRSTEHAKASPAR
ncbi:UNVERIFIED_ORG: hypothetical protein ABIB63_001599 [Xanthomonas axonopodis]